MKCPVRCVAIVVLLAGCGDPSSSIFGRTTQARVRFVNATSDVPSLNFNVNGQAAVQSVPFGTATTCQSFNPGAIEISAAEAGATSSFGGVLSTTLPANGRFTVLATGSAADPQFLVLDDATTSIGAGLSRLRIINGVPGSVGADVFVTAPDAPLGTPVASNLGFNAATSFLAVPAGQTQVRFANAGTQTVTFSGTPLDVNAGQTSTFVVAPGTTFGTFRSFTISPC